MNNGRRIRANNLQVGDVLTGHKFECPLGPVRIIAKRYPFYDIEGVKYGGNRTVSAQQLSAAGYTYVNRGGQDIGWFLAKYW